MGAKCATFALLFSLSSSVCLAQNGPSTEMYLMNVASGTSRNPDAWSMPMIMKPARSWSLMFMGQGFLVDTQQSGPRGGDKFYSTNWWMGSASHAFAGGTIQFETMLSLEPATVTDRRYPLLFQTGESAYGKPLIDAQHPHDFIMSVGTHYVRGLGDNTLLDLYYAPVGDPALGPVAFPHRASAMELPQASLGHHWQDSTHIASNVATVGIQYKKIRLEASGFYGTEPNENRWNIDWGPMNSYSGRISFFPTRNWAAQFSMGHLTRPEALEERNVNRMTASVAYSRGAWSTSFIWGRNHADSNAYLIETVYGFAKKNYLTGRAEVVDKDELFANGASYKIHAYTGGYTRDIGVFSGLKTGIGMNITTYAIPKAIQPDYGQHPFGVNVFLRVRL
jgi:hypothetical protein